MVQFRHAGGLSGIFLACMPMGAHPGLRPFDPGLRPGCPRLRPGYPGLRPGQPGLHPGYPRPHMPNHLPAQWAVDGHSRASIFPLRR